MKTVIEDFDFIYRVSEKWLNTSNITDEVNTSGSSLVRDYKFPKENNPSRFQGKRSRI